MKRSKYNVRMDPAGKAKRTVDGILFASQLEADRYKDLKMLMDNGVISNLWMQVKHQLLVGEKKIGDYVADFVYLEGGNKVVEDIKGFRTPLYRWKKKHFEAQYYPLTITEITRHRRI